MSENIFSTFEISGRGMSLQRMRLNAVANNIANANTTKGPDGEPYKRDIVVVSAVQGNSFEDELDTQISMTGSDNIHSGIANEEGNSYSNVLEAHLAKDDSPPRMVYDPSHPDADEEGYVAMPNINIVTEMVEMISAQRGFEANASVVESAKNMARDSLDI
ncbi:MAG: flagellar basal body rod protein FlgC [Ignavibacteriae bacterium]|nr:flagellar basal body rod protein FlgC [Ignavibacteriota bacterium]